jgi:ATP-binding cassette subfamily B protein
LLITHRLAQIRWADRIVVVRRGRIEAQGTHEELMQQSMSYRRIFARDEHNKPSA